MRLFRGTTQPMSVFGTKRTSTLTLRISVQGPERTSLIRSPMPANDPERKAGARRYRHVILVALAHRTIQRNGALCLATSQSSATSLELRYVFKGPK